MDEMNGKNPAANVEPLIAEAKKYKTAEEFVKAQGNPFKDSVVQEPVYHGSLDFQGEQFDVSKRGQSTKAKSAEKAFWFSTEDVAKTYAEDIPDPNAGVWDFLGDLAPKQNKSNPSVTQSYISLKNPLVHDFKGKSYRDVSYIKLIEKAISEGHDGVIFKNTIDNVGSKVNPIISNVYGVFDPKQIKTKADLTSIWNKAQEGKGKLGTINPIEKIKGI